MISLAQLERGYREGCVGRTTPDLIALNDRDCLGIEQLMFNDEVSVPRPFWYKGVQVVPDETVPTGVMRMWGWYPSHKIAFGFTEWDKNIQWEPHLATVKYRAVEVKLNGI